jgi:hypothetical protein
VTYCLITEYSETLNNVDCLYMSNCVNDVIQNDWWLLIITCGVEWMLRVHGLSDNEVACTVYVTATVYYELEALKSFITGALSVCLNLELS